MTTGCGISMADSGLNLRREVRLVPDRTDEAETDGGPLREYRLRVRRPIEEQRDTLDRLD